MINEEIRDKEVRLIGPDGAQLGVVSSKEALSMADEHNLDLVKKLCDRVAIVNDGQLIDMFDLKNNEANKANLEERFFKITGTYDKRLFEDYVAQESADMRPDLPTENTDDTAVETEEK